MGCTDFRKVMKNKKKTKPIVISPTKMQLNVMVQNQIQSGLERVRQQATDDAINTAMILLLTLPLEVLMDH